MRYYSYYPGCCLSAEGYGKAFGASTVAVNKVLGLEFIELPDWNCCGSGPYGALDEVTSFALCARNLALAEKTGFDLVAPCSSCYVFLNRTNVYLKQYADLKAKVDAALAAGNLEYKGTVKVRKVLDVYVNDVGYDRIAKQVKRSLSGLKVAPYYGCQEVRPDFGFDHVENPQSMDRLLAALGSEPVNFPMKTRCCGGSLTLSEESAALPLMKQLLDDAVRNGAQVMATGCPLCQINVDAYQARVNKKFKTDFNVPVVFFTQLMGLAFGLPEKELGLEKCMVPAEPVLAKYR